MRSNFYCCLETLIAYLKISIVTLLSLLEILYVHWFKTVIKPNYHNTYVHIRSRRLSFSSVNHMFETVVQYIQDCTHLPLLVRIYHKSPRIDSDQHAEVQQTYTLQQFFHFNTSDKIDYWLPIKPLAIEMKCKKRTLGNIYMH